MCFVNLPYFIGVMMPVLTNNQIVGCAGIRNLETSPEARQSDSAQNYIPKR